MVDIPEERTNRMMSFPFWNPISNFWYFAWFLFLAAGGILCGIVYFLDWVTGERRWGTKLLNWIGA